MKTIGDLLARDLRQRIEEIIKVDQTDEASVHSEITEYIATDRIKENFAEILRAMAEALSEPHESVGVWISGFFGSGKSSFAKILGYILANRTVLGHPASELFKSQVDDRRVAELLDLVNTRIPTDAIMFDVQVDRAVRQSTEPLSQIMYTVLLRELGYAEDFEIADLEIELEKEGKLDEFVERCRAEHKQEWRMVRKGAQSIARASAILHGMDPATYPAPDSWAQSRRGKVADITVGRFVERTFDLTARRRHGKTLVFIVDEVGQYVARSDEKLDDLRVIVEQFGKTGKNLLKARQVVAPIWIVVTSQEKLEEVVAALDSKRVQLAKVQDRFRHRVDLAPADIREVATRRVLAKKPEAEAVLRQLFRESQGQLNAACHLERTARRSEVGEDEFVQFYPYLPHYIELSIDIMSGIRLQPGAPKHYGGSNRTIIKQAYEMLVSERTALATKPIGTLVSLDRIFELVEGNLSSEKQKDISDIKQRFKDDPAGEMAVRVAKALCLLEFVRDLPRTEANIAAFLVDAVGQAAPLAAVSAALKKLSGAQFVRNTEEGWKLQTAQEKNWETERRALEPKPKDRNEIVREMVGAIFSGDARLKTHRYRDLRNFRVGVTVDGVRVGDEGQIPLALLTADDAEAFSGRVAEARDTSRHQSHQNELYWVFALNADVDELVTNLYASRQMVAKYAQLQAQRRITGPEESCLQAEHAEVARLQRRLRDKLEEALQGGTGLFRGVARDGLGKTTSEIFKKFFDLAIPDLYPKLEMGARGLHGGEAEEILRAANLNALAPVFYGGESGLNLVIRDGAKYVTNPSADVAKEVLDYLVREHGYGNSETRTGKAIETHFGGLGYGWEVDLLRLVLAVLFRAGAIEASHKGRRFDSYQDAQSRALFANLPAFRASIFTPARPLDLKTLTQAVESYEALSGKSVDVEKNAIAAAFKRWADEEHKFWMPIDAQARANHLPVLDELAEYGATLSGIGQLAADDCVRTLADQGQSLRQACERLRHIAQATSEDGLLALRQARTAVQHMWPPLSARGANGELAPRAQALGELLGSKTFYEHLAEIRTQTQAVTAAYEGLYAELHRQRAHAFHDAVEDIRGRADWLTVPAALQANVLAPLTTRACEDLAMGEGDLACQFCRATINEMESDLVALGGLAAQVAGRIQELIAPQERTVRVRVTDFFEEGFESEEAIDRGLERLRAHLIGLLADGARVTLE